MKRATTPEWLLRTAQEPLSEEEEQAQAIELGLEFKEKFSRDLWKEEGTAEKAAKWLKPKLEKIYMSGNWVDIEEKAKRVLLEAGLVDEYVTATILECRKAAGMNVMATKKEATISQKMRKLLRALEEKELQAAELKTQIELLDMEEQNLKGPISSKPSLEEKMEKGEE